MKKTLFLALTTAALLAAPRPAALAGDCGWATAGKILTGVAIGAALAHTFDCAPPSVSYVYAPAPVYCPPPPPPPVVVVPPPRVVVYGSPVYYCPPPPRVYVVATTGPCGPPRGHPRHPHGR